MLYIQGAGLEIQEKQTVPTFRAHSQIMKDSQRKRCNNVLQVPGEALPGGSGDADTES